MHPILIGILICIGFMMLIITLMRIILKAKKLRRQKQRQIENYDPYKQQ